MDWKLMMWTLSAIFLAEIGDKTQLAIVAFSASGSSRLAVFLGASAALVASSALAVLAGAALTRWVSPLWLHRGAGLLFVGFGLLLLLGGPEE